MKTNLLLSELEKLVKASEAGHFGLTLNENNMSQENAEVIRLINKAIKNFQTFKEKEKKQLTDEKEKLSNIINSISSVLINSGMDEFMAKLRENIKSAIEIEDPFASTKINGLNIEKGLKHFDYDKNEYVKILRSYTASTRKKLALLEKADKENIEKYEITIHGIKGASYGIFAEYVGRLAEELENAAMAKDMEYIKKKNPVFLETAQEFINNIEKLLNKIDLQRKKEKKDSPDKSLLLKLLYACQTCDIEEIETIIEKISAYQYEADGELVVWLEKKTEEMQYEEIADKLLTLISN